MKTILKASIIGLMLLSLSACDPGKDAATPAPAQGNGEPAVEAPPAPPPFDPAYQEHTIFNDRHSHVKEIVYTSPVDGKRMICTYLGTGTGGGMDCRTTP